MTVQLPIEGLPFDPHELAELSTPERGKFYAELGLDQVQIACAEQACRDVIADEYGRAGR